MAGDDLLGDMANQAALVRGEFSDLGQAADDIKQKVAAVNAEIKTFQDGLQKNFSDGLKTAIKNGGDFSALFSKVSSSIEDLILQLTVVNPLLNELFGGQRATASSFSAVGGAGASDTASSGSGGLLGSLFNSLGGLLEGRAGGGPVSPGTPYMVGEQGPELFVPQTAGRINNNPGGAGVNIVMNITASDASSFRSSQAQIAAQMMDAVRKAQRIR